MFNFIKQKIFNKKWLNFCLLMGVVLLSGFLCVYPMFLKGSLDKMLQTLMNDYIEQNNSYPVVLLTKGRLYGRDDLNVDTELEFISKYRENWTQYVDVPVIAEQQILEVPLGYTTREINGKPTVIYADYIKDLEEHAVLVNGVWAKDADQSTNKLVKEALGRGAYPCTVSVSTMSVNEFTIGDCFKANLSSDEENPEYAEVVIVGIIDEADPADPFWQTRLSALRGEGFMTEEDVNFFINKLSDSGTYYTENVILDHTKFNSLNADIYLYYIKQFKDLDPGFVNNCENTILKFKENRLLIAITLTAFEIPIVALLLLFIYMVSKQILEMETGEMAMLKSRGVERKKIIKLYRSQSAIISAVGAVIGIPVGYAFCKLGASTDGFLQFAFKSTADYKFSFSMIIFAVLGFGASLFFMTMPVYSLSKYTITQRRSMKISVKNKPFWEKYYLDLPILAVSLYLLINYYRQREQIALGILSGSMVDPIMFLDSSLFIFGCGLFALRISHRIVKTIYRIGQKRWKPAEYVAFLQIIRNFKKQSFISIFLVMTIAMGLFNANLARSVNTNMEERTKYDVGCDYCYSEQWKLTTVKLSPEEVAWNYKEPSIQRFNDLEELGVEQMTKVIRDDNAFVNDTYFKMDRVTLLGINTKEFGETAELRKGLNDIHWYHYLNALAEEPEGVIISRNLAEDGKFEVGDSIEYGRYSPVNDRSVAGTQRAVIVGIVDAFPGYTCTDYDEMPNGKYEAYPRYLIVANYSTVMRTFRTRPYSIWMKLSDDADPEAITKAIEDKGIITLSAVSTEEVIRDNKNSVLVQITNGMFSIGFIISIIVCGAGFLIYWILTIKERELIYGIYRAMGMSMKEIIRMLVVEQIFGSLLSCLGGFIVGIISTYLFVKLIAVVYLPQNHSLPLAVFMNSADIIKMVAIIGGVLVVCLFIISRLIKSMNITQALKLGED